MRNLRVLKNIKGNEHIFLYVAIVLIAVGVTSCVWFVINNNTNQTSQQSTANTGNGGYYKIPVGDSNNSNCVSIASATYRERWDREDADGDGKIDFSPAHQINSDYYDNMISCHTSYPIATSASEIKKYQDKRESDQKEYEIKLNALGNILRSSGSSGGSTHCTSRTIAGSTYTDCY